MSPLSSAARAGMRWSVWARLLVLAEVALALKRKLDLLEPEERRDLQRIVRKSKGRPSNLDAAEREQLRTLVAKLEPTELAKELASAATSWRRRR